MNKINLEKLYQNGIFENKIDTTCRLIISKEMIDKYLEKPNIIPKRIFHTSQIGVVNGMAWTVFGGKVLIV